MSEKESKLKICFAASSGGHYEQLMMLKPLMGKYDSFIMTEKTDYKAKLEGKKTYYVMQVNRKEKLCYLKLIAISFYVFGGKGVLTDNSIRPYVEYDCTYPNTAYGRTKLEGEKFVRLFNDKHYIIRTAWLYGEGKNFVRTMLELSQKNGQLKVVHDQRGTPTSTEELTGMIKYLIDTDNYGLFHGTCEGQCTWYEFTKEIFRQKGIATEVIPCTTQEYPRPAPRPEYSVLENYMLKMTSTFMFKEWQQALEIYLQR